MWQLATRGGGSGWQATLQVAVMVAWWAAAAHNS